MTTFESDYSIESITDYSDNNDLDNNESENVVVIDKEKEKDIIITLYRYLYETGDINKTFDEVYEFYITLLNVYEEEYIINNVNILSILYNYVSKNYYRTKDDYENIIKKLYHIINENVIRNPDKRLIVINEYNLISFILSFEDNIKINIKKEIINKYFNICDFITLDKYENIINFIENQRLSKLILVLRKWNIFNKENIKIISYNFDNEEFYITT